MISLISLPSVDWLDISPLTTIVFPKPSEGTSNDTQTSCVEFSIIVTVLLTVAVISIIIIIE